MYPKRSEVAAIYLLFYYLLYLATSYAGAQSPADRRQLKRLQQKGTKDILDRASVRAVSELEKRGVCVACPSTPHSQNTAYGSV